jgi:hypothetical protein
MATNFEPELLTGDRSPESFYGVLMTSDAFHFIGVRRSSAGRLSRSIPGLAVNPRRS